jgi:hypothetical protein
VTRESLVSKELLLPAVEDRELGQDPRGQMSSIVPQSADGGSNLNGKRKTAVGTVRTTNRAGRR